MRCNCSIGILVVKCQDQSLGLGVWLMMKANNTQTKHVINVPITTALQVQY